MVYPFDEPTAARLSIESPTGLSAEGLIALKCSNSLEFNTKSAWSCNQTTLFHALMLKKRRHLLL